MKIKNIAAKITLLIVCFSLSHVLSAKVNTEVNSYEDLPSDSLNSEETNINLVLEEISKKRITGSISIIDPESELLRDSRSSIASAINGKVPGVFDSYNIWGTGNAIVVVDGIRQDAYYYERLNLMEVESIVVLKDGVSKALYGAQGDQGVVLINTKRGKIGPQRVRISGEYSLSEPRTLPNFLNSIDYMEKYNEAQLNDGVDPLSLKFSQTLIDSSRINANSARYPDNDFYTEEFLRKYTRDVNIFADVMGGDEDARYYVSTEWAQSDGWLSTVIPDKTNRFNFRGNLDFKINQYMKMAVDASARLNLNERPNTGSNYWSEFASILPNAYPVLWDPMIITDQEARDLVLAEANLVDGKLLGGSSSFANDNIYGNLEQNGKVRDQQRNVQFGGKLDLDLSFLTEGLKAKAYAGMNFYNSLFTEQNYEYAIYEPVFDELTGLCDTLIMHGVDTPSDSYNTNSSNSNSFRQISYYGNLSYDRNFDKHDVSAVAIIYGDQLTIKDTLQRDVLFHTGFSANYMYNKRYIAEVSMMGIGSRKLAEGDRMELAPSAGVAWVVSNEDFMDNLSLVNYLKLRASYGISKNDDWGAYYLYANTFVEGSGFNYFNGTHSNDETLFASVANEIYLQKRKDFSIGLDASMLNNTLNVEMGYFSSTSLDNITLMSNTYPQLMGFENLLYSNYNSNNVQGIELGINYTYKISNDFSATLGSNVLHISPKITKHEEPVYEGADVGLVREGTATDAMWALDADGLYSEQDFNTDGSLVDAMPIPTFGDVQPGDIKYLDQNGDNVIDQKDQRIIGNSMRTQFSAYLDLRFRNISFYVLGIGRLGDSNYRSGSYFQVFGDIKYSEYAMQAYGPNNKDVNALHPRLSAISGGHNDRNSSFWLYENNSFTLPTMQLTYHFKGANKMDFLNDSRVYVRSSNLVVMGKNKEYSEVNPYGVPKLGSMVLGLMLSF